MSARLIGMVHLLPLPGSPGWQGDVGAVVERARQDAAALAAGGCDALLVENMGDRPYLKGRAEPEAVAAMAVAVARVVEEGLPTGVQVLAAANREALGIAVACGCAFIRVEAFAHAHVADEGWLDACAGELLRARRALGADVEIWADVKKKHSSHAVTADLTLAETARQVAFLEPDGLVVTGARTGEPTSLEDVRAAAAAGLPVAVGSGVTDQNAAALAGAADALIVGTWLKQGGDWQAPVDPARVRRLRHVLDVA